jgi:hypothetical protein
MIKPLEDTVLIEDLEAADEERGHNSAQILMKLFNLYTIGRLSVLDTTPVVYAFRNAPHNCHRSTHSVSFASSFKDFRDNHLPLINNYGFPNSVVTAYKLNTKKVEQGFKELGTNPADLDTAEMQSHILQCAYFLVLKPAIAESYEIVIKGKPAAESGIDKLMKNIL